MQAMKERFVIEGLGGEKTLSGTVSIHGAKNAVLPGMAAALLFKDALTIDNVPGIEDVKRLTELLEGFGAVVVEKPNRSLTIDTTTVTKTKFDRAVARRPSHTRGAAYSVSEQSIYFFRVFVLWVQR